MSGQQKKVARIIHVGMATNGAVPVVLMVGDIEHAVMWEKKAPNVGELFSITLVENSHEKFIVHARLGSADADAWTMHGDAMRWRKRTGSQKSRMEILWQRHAIRRAVRDYLDGEGFIEIESPLLHHGTTPDAIINAFRVEDRYLTTSTEHQIKRLEVGGFDKLYTLTKNFRAADGEGSTHNPEFTMLEWDRVGASLTEIEKDAEQIFLHAHKKMGGGTMLTYQGRSLALSTPWPRITVAEAVERHTGVALKTFELDEVRHAVTAAGIAIHESWANDRSFLFSILMDHLQPHLGFDRPTFVHDWPSFMTSMAPGGNNMLSERSELYVCGIELSNGFPSVINAAEQRAGFERQLERRRHEGKAPVELDTRLLAAQAEGLPACTGMAMGFDRLVMILTDQADIRTTLAFAWDEV